MNKAKAKARYTEYSQDIQEYMNIIISDIQENYGEVPDRFIVSLDLIADTYEVRADALKNIKTKGVMKEDKYHGEQGNQSVTTFFQAQRFITDMIKSFALTPMAKSRMKENKEKVDIDSVLEKLTA